ncbi:alanine/glycine:cation symporter family protein [Kordiimonas sp.]|uniref:alanine/glycine:cation symporter family protein n=1 Tax=Kordiimonas sp. TaxID=1970157 RepID=UPI003A9210D7
MTEFKRACIAAFAAMAITAPSLAADEDARSGFVQTLADAINALGDFVFAQVDIFGLQVEWIVAFLALPMILLTFYFGFVNITSFRRAWHILRGDFHDPAADGEVTQFQALSTALSGTVGLGNIAGVAVAISTGGPGATFWMILIGFCAMSLKFAECTLGVKYRDVRADGTVAGGPMYYLERGLQRRGWGKAGKILAWTYALLALPTLMQVAQVNQSFEAVSVVTGLDSEPARWGFGIFIAIITAIVIIGGLRSIASVTSRLVPAMAGIYITGALVIIGGHITEVPAAFATIVSSAFSLEAGMGGLIGTMIIAMQRAVYSTEAGLGSATMAHAAAQTKEPVSEGMVALMEPFIDTVVVSTMTALVIVITGVYLDGAGAAGVSLTSAAFGSVISWFPWVLAVAAFLFGYSTIISWAYYSGKIWEFIFNGSKRSMTLFKVIFCTALIPGAVLSVSEVYTLIDSMFFLMAIPNVIGIYLMAPELKADLKSYLSRLRAGQIGRNTPR